jgi:membrane peptidoglycan carboxypeptidase
MVSQAESEEERELARVRNIQRKLDELRYALALEKKYTKDEILERYLNIAYFGAGAFGVQSAAQRFFGVNAADLDIAQAATLAGAVRTPYDTDPSIGKDQQDRLLRRRNLVIDRMAELKMITPGQARTAVAGPLGLHMRAEPGGCAVSAYPFFCVYVEHEVLTNPAFGYSMADRERRLQRGGLTIWTTIDPTAQRAAERAIAARVNPRDNQVAAETMVEPGTGHIRAMTTSKHYGRNPKNRNTGPNTTYNLAADKVHGGGLGLQAGSTFKAFTLATALSQGMRFGDGFLTPGSFVPSSGYRDCSGKSVDDPGTTIYNAGGEGSGGPYSLELGTWKSVNIFYMELEREVGLCNVVRTARSLGIKRADGTPLREVPTFTLGANEMDATTVAAAFASFAARGLYCHPMAITTIVERDGTRTEVPPACVTALDPQTADAVNHVLSGVFTKGTMAGQSIGRPAAGKTGTNNGYTSAWFAGYTPNLAAAVSVGDIRGSYRYPLTGVTIGGRYYGAVQGASLPGPIWVDSMRSALRRTPPSTFVPPNMIRFGGGFTPGLQEAMEKEKKKQEKREKREKAARDGRDGDGGDEQPVTPAGQNERAMTGAEHEAPAPLAIASHPAAAIAPRPAIAPRRVIVPRPVVAAPRPAVTAIRHPHPAVTPVHRPRPATAVHRARSAGGTAHAPRSAGHRTRSSGRTARTAAHGTRPATRAATARPPENTQSHGATSRTGPQAEPRAHAGRQSSHRHQTGEFTKHAVHPHKRHVPRHNQH